MPNWCKCYLTVTGPEADLIRFRDGANSDSFDGKITLLSNYLPIPQELFDICSEGIILPDGRVATLWRERGSTQVEEVSRNQLWALKWKFGARTRTEWCVLNWGSTSGDRDTNLYVDNPQNGRLVYRFFSAWSPPRNGIIGLSRQFPSLMFEMEFHEPLKSFEGIFQCEKGQGFRYEHEHFEPGDEEHKSYEPGEE